MSSREMKENTSSSSEDSEKLGDKCRVISVTDVNVRASRSSSHKLSKQELRKQVLPDSKFDGFERQGQAWFVATELQSDLVVEVDDIKFYLHKFPLLSRSGRLNRVVFDTRDTEKSRISLEGIPGGPEAFELAAKFCYGMAIDLTASNVAAVRCAAEYLEMTEDLEEGNLIAKTEAFLSFIVLGSWKDSLTVLRSCENLSPWSDNLQLVRRCSESIAWKACTDPRGISWSAIGKESLRKSDGRDSPSSSASSDASKNAVPPDWWFEDVLTLSVDHFLKVVAAMKVKGMNSDLTGAVVTAYAFKWIPGLSSETTFSSSRRHMTASTGPDDFTVLQDKTQKLLENIVSLLPPHQDAAAASFMLRLLRFANMHKTTAACREELEQKVGQQLAYAALNDLLVPSFSHTCNTLYDVDLMLRLVDHFLHQEQVSETSPSTLDHQIGLDDAFIAAKTKVAKLLDSYLFEVAKDPSLPLSKFQALLQALPNSLRTSDDGLYRAIDMYLKVHPGLPELERKKLCRAMDCERLSWEACLHASQNERLPLRVVVQVLLCEQMKVRNAMASALGKDLETWESSNTDKVTSRNSEELMLVREEVQKIKEIVAELQAGYPSMRQQLDKLLATRSSSKPSIVSGGGNQHQSNNSPWSTGWKKLRRASLMFQRDGAVSSPLVGAVPDMPKARLRRNSLS